jgi:hypothetical protein
MPKARAVIMQKPARSKGAKETLKAERGTLNLSFIQRSAFRLQR